MNSKGLYVIEPFQNRFKVSSIEYIVCEKDINIKFDGYKQIKEHTKVHKVTFYDRMSFDIQNEIGLNGFKFAIGWR